MATTSYAVNARDNTFTQWARTGASPYLDAEDYNTNYVYETSSTAAQYEGDFSFPDSGAENLNVLNSVTLRVKGFKVDDFETLVLFRVYIYNGVDWTNYKTMVLPYANGFVTADITDVIDSWAKIDSCKIRLYARNFLATNRINIDYAELVADYTVEGAGETTMRIQIM